MIRLENVSKVYRTPAGPVRALADVCLDVAQGEFVAIAGPSGCGKSTLLMLVGGLATPSAGRVEVAGQAWSAMSPAACARFRARHIGFVFQTFHLLPYLTVLDNVLAGAASGPHRALRQRAKDLLARFGLAPRLNHRPWQLSTGECQRVAIARAMLNQPPLILADEPTGNLDEDNAHAVFDILAEFHAGGGTVLLVTHQPTGTHRAQRTVLLREGRIVLAQPAASQDIPASSAG